MCGFLLVLMLLLWSARRGVSVEVVPPHVACDHAGADGWGGGSAVGVVRVVTVVTNGRITRL